MASISAEWVCSTSSDATKKLRSIMELSSGADEKVKSMHSMMIAVIKRLRSLESRLSTAQTSAKNKIK